MVDWVRLAAPGGFRRWWNASAYRHEFTDASPLDPLLTDELASENELAFWWTALYDRCFWSFVTPY